MCELRNVLPINSSAYDSRSPFQLLITKSPDDRGRYGNRRGINAEGLHQGRDRGGEKELHLTDNEEDEVPGGREDKLEGRVKDALQMCHLEAKNRASQTQSNLFRGKMEGRSDLQRGRNDGLRPDLLSWRILCDLQSRVCTRQLVLRRPPAGGPGD